MASLLPITTVVRHNVRKVDMDDELRIRMAAPVNMNDTEQDEEEPNIATVH